MHTADTYNGHRQETVLKWAGLHHIFEVCAQEKRFEGVAEETLMGTRGSRGGSKGKYSRGLAGGADKANMTVQPSRS